MDRLNVGVKQHGVKPYEQPPGRLPRQWAARDTVEVARGLLGQRLACLGPDGWRIGRIVETEAYLGPGDLACHSSKGRTRRTEVMFGPPGLAYVYLVYGMHRCVNVVTGAGAAVLIRALELEGRGERADGPGRLTQALGITLAHNGHPLDTSPLLLLEGEPATRISRGPRVGVDYAGAYWAKRALRFWLEGSPFVSRAPR